MAQSGRCTTRLAIGADVQRSAQSKGFAPRSLPESKLHPPCCRTPKDHINFKDLAERPKTGGFQKPWVLVGSLCWRGLSGPFFRALILPASS